MAGAGCKVGYAGTPGGSFVAFALAGTCGYGVADSDTWRNAGTQNDGAHFG